MKARHIIIICVYILDIMLNRVEMFKCKSNNCSERADHNEFIAVGKALN